MPETTEPATNYHDTVDDIRRELVEIRAYIDAADGEFITKARMDLPLLVAALEAVLTLHEPIKLYESAFAWSTFDGQEKPRCGHDPDVDGWDATHMETTDDGWVCLSKPVGTVCSTCIEDGDSVPWPCPEYETVTAALSGATGEGAT